jgi:hypothetical protein
MNRIAIIVAAAVLTFAAAPQPAAAQVPTQIPPLTPALETCIRSNAAAVERAEASMTDAVRFLTEHLCADEVLAFQADLTAAENQRYVDLLRRQCADMRAPARKPEEGEAMMATGFDPCLQIEMIEQANSVADPTAVPLSPYSLGTAPTSVLALAARLVLEARLARIGS